MDASRRGGHHPAVLKTGDPGWPRQFFEPGGGDAHLLFEVFGAFTQQLEVSRTRHRAAGVPEGCGLERFESTTPSLGLSGPFGEQLRREQPALFAAAQAGGQFARLRGMVADPPTLDYLRDVVGVVTALLDAGGVAVFDPHCFAWWSAAEWRERIFAPAAPLPEEHVVILVSDEEGGRWYHTRGLIKFGRPDLSVHHVPPKLEPAVKELFDRFIQLQAYGGVVPDGQEVRMRALPAGWRCSLTGDLDDADFNNRHLEIGPPAPAARRARAAPPRPKGGRRR